MIKHKPDLLLVLVIGVLIAVGLLILASASVFHSQTNTDQASAVLFNQLVKGLLVGLIFGAVAFFIPLRFWKPAAFWLLLLGLFGMILVFVPQLSWSSGGAKRWLKIGQVIVQPAEFFKLAIFLYLAAWLSSPSKHARQHLSFKHGLLPFALFAGLIALLLVLQPDIGTLGVILLVALLMYFAANTPTWHSVSLLVLGGVAIAALIAAAPYRLQRLAVFLNPDFDPLGASYQLKQGLIAIGSGGWFGRGIGLSQQKLGFLPQTVNDSIFAILAEETGFVGAVLLVALFLLLLWRGLKIAKNNLDQFSSLLALGLSCHIFLQMFINIAAIVGVLPLTGIPLPLVSYGGSAYVTTMIEFGWLLNISRQSA